MERPEIFENIPLELNELPSVENLQLKRLNPNYIYVLILSAAFSAFMVLAAAYATRFIPYRQVLEYRPYIFLVAGLMGLFWVFSAVLGYYFKGYLIRSHDVIFQEGWLIRKLTAVPFKRIQHAEVSQGPLGRMLDLAQLNIFTAGGSQSDLSIPGLNMDEAQKLRAFIVHTISNDEEE